MRKNGFTLIELLAVIVILAIIALIATPIILGIINDAREESNERSVELYASAVRNAVASYQLTHPNAPTKFSDLDIQYDGEVECETEELYSNGSFYITECTVNGDVVDYTYGEKQVTQVYKPQYYSWSSGNIGEELPSDAKPTVAELNPNKPFYLGLDVDADNKVIAAYACFTKNENEYCLKSTDDGSAYSINVDIIKNAYSEVLDTACSSGSGAFECLTGGLYVLTGESGHVAARGNGGCDAYDSGSFSCIEF